MHHLLDFACASVLVSGCLASAVLSARQAVPVLVPSVGPWQALGCFNDSTDARALHERVDAGNTTVESCVAACQAQGFSLAGLEFGDECWCGSELDNGSVFVGDDDGAQDGNFHQFLDDPTCNMACGGNVTELCGGSDFLDLYNFTGTFPIGASVVPFSVAWISQGCFSDSTSSRTLDRRVDAGNVTVESCVNACQTQSFTLAGLEFGQECWCGNQVNAPGALTSQGACSQACVGNETEVCGGPDALELYLFQDSPQVIGDLQELNGLSESLANFLLNITADNVQTTGPDALVGLQGIINTIGMTQSNASTATDNGQSPFLSNNVDMVVEKLQSYISFGTELSNALITASNVLLPSFQDSFLEDIIDLKSAFDDMITFLADNAVPSRAGDTLSVQAALDDLWDDTAEAFE
ncbi:WSC domain-containing protein [Gloeopeniophorella convolvens]|nr:WSC domain-containing protein [Gloeopeniophorella convolvens]